MNAKDLPKKTFDRVQQKAIRSYLLDHGSNIRKLQFIFRGRPAIAPYYTIELLVCPSLDVRMRWHEGEKPFDDTGSLERA